MSLIADKEQFAAELKTAGFEAPLYSKLDEHTQILGSLVDLDCEISCGNDAEKKAEMRQKAKDIFLKCSK